MSDFERFKQILDDFGVPYEFSKDDYSKNIIVSDGQKPDETFAEIMKVGFEFNNSGKFQETF